MRLSQIIHNKSATSKLFESCSYFDNDDYIQTDSIAQQKFINFLNVKDNEIPDFDKCLKRK